MSVQTPSACSGSIRKGQLGNAKKSRSLRNRAFSRPNLCTSTVYHIPSTLCNPLSCTNINCSASFGLEADMLRSALSRAAKLRSLPRSSSELLLNSKKCLATTHQLPFNPAFQTSSPIKTSSEHCRAFSSSATMVRIRLIPARI